MSKRSAWWTLVIFLTVGLGAALTQLQINDPLPPCAEEDSMNCYWDADTMGNGIGRSFVDINGTAYYAD